MVCSDRDSTLDHSPDTFQIGPGDKAALPQAALALSSLLVEDVAGVRGGPFDLPRFRGLEPLDRAAI